MIVQAPETAYAAAMPQAAADAVAAEATLPLMFIGPYLVELSLKA